MLRRNLIATTLLTAGVMMSDTETAEAQGAPDLENTLYLELKDGRVFVLIYTVRAAIIRIISARRANHREVLTYENSARDS